MHGETAQEKASRILRDRMPVTRKYAYFDHAAVAPLPDISADAINSYADQASLQGDVGWLNWSAQVDDLRVSAASLIAADPSDIALVGNTTQGINLVAEGIPWELGDNVVVPSNEFPSNLLPWRNLARRGVEVREVTIDDSGVVDLDTLSASIDSRTRLLSISWVGFASGYRVDVDSIVDMAHAHGCLVLLDAIQGLGAFPFDVRSTNIDFLAADGHKWMLGPEGAGILYINQAHLDLLSPLGLGWNSLEFGAFDSSATRIKSTAARYEGGTTNMGGMLGFGASLSLLLQLGANRPDSPVAAAILKNVTCMEQNLSKNGFQVHVPSDPQHRSGIIGITWSAAESDPESVYGAARKHLLKRDIVTSVRAGRLRTSVHAYNNETEIDRLVEALVDFRDH